MHTFTAAPLRLAWLRSLPGVARPTRGPAASRIHYDEWRHGSRAVSEGMATALPAGFRFGPAGAKALALHPGSALHLACVHGTLWVTRHGDAADHVLDAGASLIVPAGVSAVVQALSRGLLRVTAAPSSISQTPESP